MSAMGCTAHSRGTAGCDDCNRLNRQYRQRRRDQMREGTWRPRVPIEPVRSHLARLLDANVTMSAIAAAAGRPTRTVREVMSQRRRWIHGPTAADLLAVNGEADLTGGKTAPVIGTRRRLQALAALGYPILRLSRELDVPDSITRRWLRGRQRTISVANHYRVAALYDRLSMVAPLPTAAVRRRRKLADREGWVPPLAWNDGDIDNPNASPVTVAADEDLVDEVAVLRLMTGRRPEVVRTVDRDEAIRRLARTGLTYVEVSALVGLSASRVSEVVRRQPLGSAA